jgi:predicted aspartyl protease
LASLYLSRRIVLGSAAAALALGRARAAPPAPEPENIQGGADSANRLTVETRINGMGPYHFVVDTGADHTVMAADIAASLGLAIGEPVIVQGITSAVPAATAQLRELSFGQLSLEDVEVPILPRQGLGGDGYLGLDAINHRRVAFDFRNHVLSIGRSPSDWFAEPVHPDETLLRVDGVAGRLTSVDCYVDGVHAHAFIDSGADVSIGNSRLFAELAEQTGRTYLSGDPIVLTGVTGATALGRLAAVSRVRLGALNFEDAVLVIADLPVFDSWNLAERPALFIGMNFLERTSAVTIDYSRRELRFKVAEQRVASRGA